MPNRLSRGPGSERGGILVEGVLTVASVGLAVALNVELARRAWKEVLLHHGAFLSAREEALGGVTKSSRFFDLARERGAFVEVERVSSSEGVTAKAHQRFPSLVRFDFGRGSKHHFEVTHQCTFPYSR